MPTCPPVADMDEMPHGGMWDLASRAGAEGWIEQSGNMCESSPYGMNLK